VLLANWTSSATSPSLPELLAWTHPLPKPIICAWRAEDSSNRYIQSHPPATATPSTAESPPYSPATTTAHFRAALLTEGDLSAGEEQLPPLSALTAALVGSVLSAGAGHP
jgi:hypothetical protein